MHGLDFRTTSQAVDLVEALVEESGRVAQGTPQLPVLPPNREGRHASSASSPLGVLLEADGQRQIEYDSQCRPAA